MFIHGSVKERSSLDRHLQFHSDLTITASDGSWFKMDVSKSKKNVLHRCLICSYTTKWKHNLDAHKLRVHEKQKKIKDDAPKQCKNFCGYISVNPKNVRRHEEKCKWSGPGIISVEDVINMVCNTGASFTDTNYIMKLIRTRCGPRAVEPNLVRKIAEMIRQLSVWFSDEFVDLKDRHGNLVRTCVSRIRFLKEFREWVAQGRGITNPVFSYSMDGGQGKFVIVINIYDKDAVKGRDRNGHLSTGCRLTLPILQCDIGKNIPENKYNVTKLCGLVEFPEDENFTMTTDLKGVNIGTGQVGVTGMFFCANGKCYKINEDTFLPTNKRGPVIKCEDRLVSFQVEQNHLFQTVGKGNKLKMSRYSIYCSCHTLNMKLISIIFQLLQLPRASDHLPSVYPQQEGGRGLPHRAPPPHPLGPAQ